MNTTIAINRNNVKFLDRRFGPVGVGGIAQDQGDQVAALFSMHRRTQNRRLNAFGSGFQKLVDEIRFEIARQMLEDSSAEVTKIATLLD